jgi:DNA-directed RNA polymerase specialized sigma24 family protein
VTQKEIGTLERNRYQLHRLHAQLVALSEPVRANSITGTPSGGGEKNAVEAIVVRSETVRAEIEALQQESRRICFQVDPPRTRKVFMLFYVEGMSWRQVADEMGYGDDSIARKLKRDYLIRKNLA